MGGTVGPTDDKAGVVIVAGTVVAGTVVVTEEFGPGEAVAVAVGDDPGLAVGVGAEMVVVVPAALACKLSRVDHEPTICQMLKTSHSAVQAAHIQTAARRTTIMRGAASAGSAPTRAPAFLFPTPFAIAHPHIISAATIVWGNDCLPGGLIPVGYKLSVKGQI